MIKSSIGIEEFIEEVTKFVKKLDKEELVGDTKVRTTLAAVTEMAELRSLRQQGKKQYNHGLQERKLQPIQGCAWKNPIEDLAERKRGLREMVDFQG